MRWIHGFSQSLFLSKHQRDLCFAIGFCRNCRNGSTRERLTRLCTIIIALVPTALRGVQYKPVGASTLLRWNLLVYGVGGIEFRSATIAACFYHLSSTSIFSDARCEMTPLTILRIPSD
jgi:hypothetical protein